MTLATVINILRLTDNVRKRFIFSIMTIVRRNLGMSVSNEPIL